MLIIDSLVTDELLAEVDQLEMQMLLTSILDAQPDNDQVVQGEFCELLATLPEDCI